MKILMCKIMLLVFTEILFWNNTKSNRYRSRSLISYIVVGTHCIIEVYR